MQNNIAVKAKANRNNTKTKNQLGQFFTTNSDYILQGFESFITRKDVIDPFAGDGDLMAWALKNKCQSVIGYDCDKKYINNKDTILNDSINNPQRYRFVCTNPPYLHKNKANQVIKKRFFSGRNEIFEDLYQVSICSLIDSEEGILIVPLNFLSSENSRKIREIFFSVFEIIKMNAFTQQVFNDTTYNVISFYFRKRKDKQGKNDFPLTIFPDKKTVNMNIEKRFGWQLGGEFLYKVKNTKNNLGIFRLTRDFIKKGSYPINVAIQNIKDKKIIKVDWTTKKTLDENILLLRAIDSKNGKKIQIEDIREYKISGLVGKNTSRNMAQIIFNECLPIREQKELAREFNEKLNQKREKYLSYFLTNFRDNNRKRISFEFAYKFLNYIYEAKNSKQSILF
jgi:hypothetical protein